MLRYLDQQITATVQERPSSSLQVSSSELSIVFLVSVIEVGLLVHLLQQDLLLQKPFWPLPQPQVFLSKLFQHPLKLYVQLLLLQVSVSQPFQHPLEPYDWLLRL